jgi:hypothetical protein
MSPDVNDSELEPRVADLVSKLRERKVDEALVGLISGSVESAIKGQSQDFERRRTRRLVNHRDR